MAPVAKRDSCCVAETFSTGLAISPAPATTKAHFRNGAQKWIVFGPVSEFRNLLKAFEPAAPADIACCLLIWDGNNYKEPVSVEVLPIVAPEVV